MGKLIYKDDTYGYEYISNNGIKYSLYELTALGGEATSDICFIVNDCYCEIDDEVYKNGKVYPFSYMAVGWFYGATFIGDPEYEDEYIKEIERLINDYEKENPEIVELILKQIENRDDDE